ncbi:MAG: alpha/beta hydrolase [bacterium]|nr:alpha/beta hydrolase [bacterium]
MHLILLPGMDGTGDLFAPLVDELIGAKVSVISYPSKDCLGWEPLLQFIRQAIPRDEPITLVAESFSGPLGIMLAARKSHNVRALVLCASFASSPLPRWLRHVPVPGFALKALPRFVVQSLLLDSTSSSEQVATIHRCVKSVPPKILAGRFRMIQQVDVRSDLREVHLPILYLAGRKDRLVPKRCSNEITGSHAGSSRVILDGPHLLLQSSPEPAANEIRKFLGSTFAQ